MSMKIHGWIVKVANRNDECQQDGLVLKQSRKFPLRPDGFGVWRGGDWEEDDFESRGGEQ
jgi:hypothetical protein